MHLDVVCAIIVYDHRILCMQRGKGKNVETSYKFEFPGGKVDPGESPPEALMRELNEELDINVSISETDYYADVFHVYPGFEMTMHSFFARPASDKFNMKEHLSYRWLTVDELPMLDWAPADIKLVKKLIENKVSV